MTNAPDDLGQQRTQVRIALGGFPVLAFASTRVIARADANPGSKVFSAWKPTQIDPHLRDNAHRRHRLHAWMRHQELHHRLIGLHLRFDLLKNLLHGGLQELQLGEDLLQQHPVMRLDPPFQGFLHLRQFAAQGPTR